MHRILLAALVLAVVPSVQAQDSTGNTFTWDGQIPQGSWLHVRNINGGITVEVEIDGTNPGADKMNGRSTSASTSSPSSPRPRRRGSSIRRRRRSSRPRRRVAAVCCPACSAASAAAAGGRGA